MAASVSFDKEIASYVVALAASPGMPQRTLFERDGADFILSLEKYYGQKPVHQFLEKSFNGKALSDLTPALKKLYAAIYENKPLSIKQQVCLVKHIISLPVGKEYIENIPFAQPSELIPVRKANFFLGLEAVYGKTVVARAIGNLSAMKDSAFKGVADFKKRTVFAADGDLISVVDQQYIQNYVLSCS